jgi:flagellar biosynthesis GTPase FlhF
VSEPEIKTYRGASLEELLPQIRDELGPDAVVLRQREGIVGGVGGFFGKRCVEVDVAPPPRVAHGPAVPRGTVFDAYDSPLDIDMDADDEHALDFAHDDEPELRPAPPADSVPAPHGEGDLMETLLAQASPFADELAQAWETEVFATTEPEPFASGAEDVRAALAAAGVPQKVADAVLAEAQDGLAPFAPELPLADHARTALARRLAVDAGGRSPRRIALVGLPQSGRTLAAAKLCAAYARSGHSVCAVSLEQARRAFELATVTEPFGVALEVADHPDSIELVRKRFSGYDVVVADTPAVDLEDPASIARLAVLLRALKPTETILVADAGASADVTRLLVRALRAEVRVRSLLVTHADRPRPRGTPVGVSLSEKVPVAYVSDGPLAGTGLRPAAADDLARMVLP